MKFQLDKVQKDRLTKFVVTLAAISSHIAESLLRSDNVKKWKEDK